MLARPREGFKRAGAGRESARNGGVGGPVGADRLGQQVVGLDPAGEPLAAGVEALEVHVTKSVGDRRNQLVVYVDAGSKPRYGGWWRAVWDGRYVYRPGQNGWLYDHDEDPHEMVNLMGSPEHAAIRRKLARRLLEFAEETEDPVLPELRALPSEP